MGLRIERGNINKATLFVDLDDTECQEVEALLKKRGVPFEIEYLGRRDHGYGIEIAVVSGSKLFTQFSAHSESPVLVVEHSPIGDGRSLKVAILEGQLHIKTGLGI